MTTISTLPPAPLITDAQSVFNAKAFALVQGLNTFVGEGNTVAGEVNANAGTAATAATTATAAAQGAAASAIAAGQAAGAPLWVSGTTYAALACVLSPVTFYPYRRRTAGGGITDPSADPTNWALAAVPGKLWTVSNAAAVTVLVNQMDMTKYAGACTWTLPSSPQPQDRVGVKVGNGRLDNVINPNGKPIEGLAGNMTVDAIGAAVNLVYIDNVYGWVLE